jgi:hypothetical protein
MYTRCIANASEEKDIEAVQKADGGARWHSPLPEYFIYSAVAKNIQLAVFGTCRPATHVSNRHLGVVDECSI